MLERSQPLALYMEGALGETLGKMGHGLLRYSRNPIACVVDSTKAGGDVSAITGIPSSAPVVSSVGEAVSLGGEALVLGIAPPGGLIPPAWMPAIDEAISGGMSIVNGLHDLLGPRYSSLAPGQWIWDVRVEPAGLGVGSGAAGNLSNKRVLMIGTDMAIGKMTAGLELQKSAIAAGHRAEFVATGQIGIVIAGSGVPLDAVRVDYATGAIEREVLRYADADLVIIEGQGALIHPGSTSTLPLLRGGCPTHLILCHRAGQETLFRVPSISIPRLSAYVRLYEDLGSACGTFPRPVTAGVALNTSHLGEAEARAAIERVGEELILPCTDPVRFGADVLVSAVMGA